MGTKITRTGPSRLDPHATHDVAEFRGALLCGGKLMVADTRARRDRYELYCEKCASCWPGILDTLADVAEAVREMSSDDSTARKGAE